MNDQIEKITKKKTEKPVERKNSKKETADKDAKRLWTEATNMLKNKKKMSAVTAMKKAVPKSLEDGILTITYDENLAGLERLEEKASQRMINEALTGAAGSEIKMRIEMHVPDEEEINFLEDINKFPKELINK